MLYTVLGSSGFIGSHLAEHLLQAGHEVYAPQREELGSFERDLGVVIYAVGLTADFRSRPFDTVRAHVCLLTDILERCRFSSLLYLSSTRVYAGNAAGNEDARLGVDPQDASDLYNLTKLTGESICRTCGRGNVKVARLSNVIGDDPASGNFLFTLIREALAGQIVLQSHLESAKDYILIDDVIRLLVSIASDGKQFLYNVASGKNLSHQQVVTTLQQLTGCTVSAAPDLPRFCFPLLSIDRIRDEFGFEPLSVLDRVSTMLSCGENFQKINNP